mmetsp:Transcript_55504/g.116162  ORF Transcript_55504/g.116162 Transcript_55504/m.116162 type:complete len:309 (-) Transcript_55504:117-1043(-)
MITMITSEWNIDLASENLGSGRDEQVATNELGENEMTFCKYDGELTYMYEPDVLDSLPPATTALYGSEPDSVQGQLQKYPILMPDEANPEIQEWSDPQPTTPSQDSVDSSYESQVSTPQASPRRCEEDVPQVSSSKPAKTKIEKEIKERKRETRQTEQRVKQPRISKSQAVIHRDTKEATPDLPSRGGGSRTRSASPVPDEDDDPQGLFLRDPSTLTPEEVKLLKKRKRLIKNRESAQLSRQRKRLRLETLQAEVLHLEDENKALHSRVDQLMEENAALKRKLLGGSGSGSAGKTRSSAAAAAAASVH